MIEAIDQIDSVSSNHLLDQSGQSVGEMQRQTELFDRMMADHPDALHYNDALNNDHSTVATQFVQSGDELMRHTYSEMQRFITDAPNLTMPELTSRNIELNFQVAMTQFQFNSCTYVAQSAKSGLQTLMKNQ